MKGANEDGNTISDYQEDDLQGVLLLRVRLRRAYIYSDYEGKAYPQTRQGILF
jgi:hypothetical protein